MATRVNGTSAFPGGATYPSLRALFGSHVTPHSSMKFSSSETKRDASFLALTQHLYDSQAEIARVFSSFFICPVVGAFMGRFWPRGHKVVKPGSGPAPARARALCARARERERARTRAPARTHASACVTRQRARTSRTREGNQTR